MTCLPGTIDYSLTSITIVPLERRCVTVTNGHAYSSTCNIVAPRPLPAAIQPVEDHQHDVASNLTLVLHDFLPEGGD
mgnify:CR=1 FL=1